MAEKVVDKLLRLSRDLADSVRHEIELTSNIKKLREEIATLKTHIGCYISSRENIHSKEEAISFLKGFYEARKEDADNQLKFKFPNKN